MKKNSHLFSVVNQLIKVSFTEGKLNQKKVKEIVDSLKKLSVGSAIPALSLYLKGLKRELDQHRLVIETPVMLTTEQIDEIAKIVGRSTEVFETEVIVKPELLGGFKIKIGDEVYEDTISDRVEQLRKKIFE